MPTTLRPIEVSGPIKLSGSSTYCSKEVLDAVADLGWFRADQVADIGLQVLDDRGHLVDELFGLVDEWRHDERDHAGECRNAEQEAGECSDRTRDPAGLEPVGDDGQRDRDDHRDQDRHEQRDQLLEEQPEHEQPGRQEHCTVGDRKLSRVGHPRPSTR